MDALSSFIMSDELSDAQSYRSADEAPVVGVPVGAAESRYLPDADASLSLPFRPREVMQSAEHMIASTVGAYGR